MKKLTPVLAILFLVLSSACNKEITCECQSYIVDEDGTRIADGEPDMRVLDSKDADCSDLDDYQDSQIGNDRELKCTEASSDD